MSDIVPITNSDNLVMHEENIWRINGCQHTEKTRFLQDNKKRHDIEVCLHFQHGGQIRVSGYYVECFRCDQQIFISLGVDGKWILQQSEYGKLHHCHFSKRQKGLREVGNDNAKIMGWR